LPVAARAIITSFVQDSAPPHHREPELAVPLGALAPAPARLAWDAIVAAACAEAESPPDGSHADDPAGSMLSAVANEPPPSAETLASQSPQAESGTVELTSAQSEAITSDSRPGIATPTVADLASYQPLAPGDALIRPTESLSPVPTRELCRTLDSEEPPTVPAQDPASQADTAQARAGESPAPGLLVENLADSQAPATKDGATEPATEGASGEATGPAGSPSETQELAAAEKASEPATGEVADPAPAAEESRAEKAVLGFDQRPITSLTVNIAAKAGELPSNLGKESLARVEMQRPEAVLLRHWPLMGCQWEAPALAYRPLYFEEVNLERYGYGMKYLRAAQPIVSAGQFFTTVPMLPYKMLAEPARTPVYTLGHYRPGSDVPYRPVFPPLSISGSAAEAGVAAGLIFVIP